MKKWIKETIEDIATSAMERALDKKFKTNALGFWALCEREDIEVQELLRVVEIKKSKLEENDRLFAAGIAPHISK